MIASIGPGVDGQSYNINADDAAAAVALATSAYKAIFLTDVAGWLENPEDPESLISQATPDELRAALDSVEGGMRPKLEACLNVVDGGVGSAHIVDGRVAHSLLLELFTDAGMGTKIAAAE